MSTIDTSTRLYGVIGNPVKQSLGPAMHNFALSFAGINAVYLAFEVHDLPSAVGGMRALNIAGISVTVPYKVAIMPYLDALDNAARRIGAVNTVCNDNGVLTGYNTDAHGAVAAIEESAGSLNGRDVVVLGAGGAARAIAHGSVQKGANLYIANRTPEKGLELADELGVRFCRLSEIHSVSCDILVNTTPVGMYPDTDSIPVLPEILRPNTYVMDMVYNPVSTCLLKEAEKRGCKIIDGVSMFVHQGAMQFFLWTGQDPPVEKMKQIVYEKLTEA